MNTHTYIDLKKKHIKNVSRGTIKEIKGNVRFAIYWATEENYQPLAGHIGEDEAEWSKQPFATFGDENEEQLAYRWFDEKAEEIITNYLNKQL